MSRPTDFSIPTTDQELIEMYVEKIYLRQDIVRTLEDLDSPTERTHAENEIAELDRDIKYLGAGVFMILRAAHNSTKVTTIC